MSEPCGLGRDCSGRTPLATNGHVSREPLVRERLPCRCDPACDWCRATRTGTSSLRDALRHLLDAPVYHMSEAFAHPEHARTWVAAINGDPPVWSQFLAGYAAGVDAPFSNCWRDLAVAYPDAPVLLSHRGSADVWHRSMAATVLPRTREML